MAPRKTMTDEQQEEVRLMFETLTTNLQEALQTAVQNALTTALQDQRAQREAPGDQHVPPPRRRDAQLNTSDDDEIIENVILGILRLNNRSYSIGNSITPRRESPESKPSCRWWWSSSSKWWWGDRPRVAMVVAMWCCGGDQISSLSCLLVPDLFRSPLPCLLFPDPDPDLG
ncbi:hypothetical protein F2Q68_00045856 [Brassica cretica]|uniref:Uncharacterized protein n=2 Tax=Brassica cretica TaxID=69181 RepID=A0ABQ7AV06_BRACR|nr:hypothetical protein F2Q68_00045856 [Brassica cretica]KAF3517868.1 hypothetical protein DY000_02062987 [Brassica cretica]